MVPVAQQRRTRLQMQLACNWWVRSQPFDLSQVAAESCKPLL